MLLYITHTNTTSSSKQKSLLDVLQECVLEHHDNYKKLYMVTYDQQEDKQSKIVNPHVGLHWKADIEMWGMPLYFSTMHWEPKHKQLKLLKNKQTNNSNHPRDILVHEWYKQMERTILWNNNQPQFFPLQLPDMEPVSKYVVAKKALQRRFQEYLTIERIGLLKEVIYADFDVAQLVLLKYVVAFRFKIVPGDNMMVDAKEELWFAKVTKIVGYYVGEEMYSIYLRLHWYKTKSSVTVDGTDHFSFIQAKPDASKGWASLTSVLSKILVYHKFEDYVNTDYPLLLDANYYMKKWHNMLDAKDRNDTEQTDSDG